MVADFVIIVESTLPIYQVVMVSFLESNAPKSIKITFHHVNSYICTWLRKRQQIGAAAYRKLRAEGRTAFPKPIILPEGINGTIPSREPDREIPYRMFKPENGASKGVLLHIHGGGWVLQSEASQDQYLKTMADTYELSVWCVGYRLAPEDPWPAGVNDCYDAAEWLVDNAEAEYGSPLVFACGEVRMVIVVLINLLTASVCGRSSYLISWHSSPENPPWFYLQRPTPTLRVLRLITAPPVRASS